MKHLSLRACAAIAVCLLAVIQTHGAEQNPKQLQTDMLGGVKHPSAADLKAMHQAQYILHARRGKLTNVPVEKIRLPHDPKATPQSIQAALAPDGTVFVTLESIVCKSTDGGRTWTSHQRGSGMDGYFAILSNGTFIGVAGSGVTSDPVAVVASNDEGRTWEKTSQIALPPNYNERYFYGMFRLPDDTLICGIAPRDHLRMEGGVFVGSATLLTWRSTDKGITWEGPSHICAWGSEGGIVKTASGKLLAVTRYQRQLEPDDPPWLKEKSGGRGYKNVFLADSLDQGRTWENFRQLTTVYGQTRGYGAALSDGTVVVIHDTRYGPGHPGNRAMISYDEGETWADEVYHMDCTTFTGSYNASVVLEDDLILTICGTSDAGNSWKAVVDHTDFTAIRWRPAKKEEQAQSEMPRANWSPAQTKQARMEARRRTRRIIYNDDGEEMAHQGADTAEGFLAPRLKALVGTQVDTICWSILGNWGDAPSYDSKVQPIHGDASGGPPAGFKTYARNFKALIDGGLCPLRIVTDFAHQNGMELFASVRMNDVHDSFVSGLITIWKKQHPELLVDRAGMLTDGTKDLYVTAQDYTHSEVRQRKFEVFEEVCGRYDIDGFELDFIRQPVYFSPTMRGQPVTDEQVEIMTSFVRRIRKLTDDTAARRERPLLVAAHVPDTLQLAIDIGLDVKRWLKEGLVDVLIVGGGYAPFTLSAGEITKLAHQYQVPVYPCINQKPPAYAVLTEQAALGNRGLASNWYRQGADGIYFWNLGVPLTHPLRTGEDLINTRRKCYACLSEVGDPKVLAGKDKLFGVDGPVFHFYAHVSGRPPLPTDLTPGNVQRVPLLLGDDVQAAAKSGLLAQLELKMDLKGPVSEDGLRFRLNDKPLAGGEFSDRDAKQQCTVGYSLGAPLLKMGENIIEASLENTGTASAEPVQLTGLQLRVKYN